MTPVEVVQQFPEIWLEYTRTLEYIEKMRLAQEIAIMDAEGEG